MKYKPELHKLSNGVPVIFDPMDLETAQFKIVFFTGSRDEKPNEYGITHFCEHMFCKGSKRFPNHLDLREYLADNGCVANAATGASTLRFYGKCVARNLNILIDCIGEQLESPLFDKNEIEHERGPILDEFRRDEDARKNKQHDFIYKTLFNTDYDHTLGTAENIKSFTRKKMLFFIRRRMSSKNCVVIVSGKIENKAKTLKQLEKSFGFLKPFDVPQNNKIKYKQCCAHKTEKNRNNVVLRIVFPVLWPKVDKKFIFERMCVNKFRCVLDKKIREKLRYENGLVYTTNGVYYGNANNGVYGISTQTSPEHIEKSVEIIAKTCADLYYNNSFSDDDVARIEKSAEFDDAEYLDSVTDRANDFEKTYRDYQELDDFPERVRIGKSITRDDIIKNSRGFFDGKPSIITNGPKFKGDLMRIWQNNFKPTNENVLLSVKQKKKTR